MAPFVCWTEINLIDKIQALRKEQYYCFKPVYLAILKTGVKLEGVVNSQAKNFPYLKSRNCIIIVDSLEK